MQPEQPEQPDYEVGYKKPPEHSRWKRGHCPNPNGRPRKSKKLDAILYEVLDEKVAYTENGRRRKTNKAEAMFKTLVNDAVKGDKRAVQIVLRTMEAFARLKTRKAKSASSQNGEPPVRSGIVILPDNGRDPQPPELLQAQLRIREEYAAGTLPEQQPRRAANENRKKEVA